MAYQKFHKPKWTFVLILICIFIFILEPKIPGTLEFNPENSVNQYYSFIPTAWLERPWTFVTSIFLHGDLSHLFFNMLALFLFGIYLEPRIKTRHFFLIFFLAGILGNFAYLVFSFGSTIPAIGASGAIFGILGTLAILFPGLIIWFGYIPMPAIFAALIWGIISFLDFFGPPTGIVNEAHLAGLFFGVLYGFYLRRKIKKVGYF